jgi:succinate-acetate transporter protein
MAEIVPIPTAWALMGYTVGVAVYGTNLLLGIPKGDATPISKGLAAFGAFAYGAIAELIAAIWFLTPYGADFLGATTFGVYGTFWLGLAVLTWTGGDAKPAAFMAVPVWIFSFIDAAAYYMAGAPIVALLVALIGLIFLMLTPGWYTGKSIFLRAGGAIAWISIIVSLYLVAAVIFNTLGFAKLPL